MHTVTGLIKTTAALTFASVVCSLPALAETFVYVSNAETGDIATYRLLPDSGELQQGAYVPAGKMVMPMAVSPDRRFLFAAIRSKPYSVLTYSIDPGTGALRRLASAPLAESMAYISLDKTGRYLFGASYGGNLVSVNRVNSDGRVTGEALQVIPTGRNAHSIRVDETNKFVYVPTLGSDQIDQFHFDAKSGRMSSNTPAMVQLQPSSGPRHFVTSPVNRFLFAVNEMKGTVTTFALDNKNGRLTELSSAFGLPGDTQLVAGAARGTIGGVNAPSPRNTDKDIWAADIHLTPNGKFLYMSERTSSTLARFSIHPETGKLTYLGSTPTEKQPRGFAIDAKGKFLIASGEKSDTISVYAIDQADGALHPLRQYPTGKGANWIEIVGID
jgi:6-phosphogluconolactonase